MKLSDFVENPDNPQKVSDAAFEKVVRLVRENPEGLRADRIAFVTDHPAGRFVVLSGCKRLRALKKIHGDAFDAPSDWFQDVTAMSEDQRNEFIVNANVNEGKFDADKLLAKYGREELVEWVGEDRIGDLISVVETTAAPSTSGEATADGPTTDATRLVEFKLLLSSADYKRAIESLRRKSDDLSVAFMEVINGRA